MPIPKRAVFERTRRELSLDVSVGVHVLLVVKQSSLESQSRGCAKTPKLIVLTKSGLPLQYYSGFCRGNDENVSTGNGNNMQPLIDEV